MFFSLDLILKCSKFRFIGLWYIELTLQFTISLRKMTFLEISLLTILFNICLGIYLRSISRATIKNTLTLTILTKYCLFLKRHSKILNRVNYLTSKSLKLNLSFMMLLTYINMFNNIQIPKLILTINTSCFLSIFNKIQKNICL
jgi:hypothetical protein